MICEKGLGVSNGCLPAKQSAIFAFSAENSKIARMFAHFSLPEGTGEAQIWPSAGHSGPILSFGNRAGALSRLHLPKDSFAIASPFNETLG